MVYTYKTPVSINMTSSASPSTSTSTVIKPAAKTKSNATTATGKKKRATQIQEEIVTDPIAKTPKGRKTRGSKIVTKSQIASTVTTPALTNIILNLKCSMTDLKEYNDKLSKMISNPLEYNSSAPPEVKYYDGEKSFGAFIRSDMANNNDMQHHHSPPSLDDTEDKSMSSFLSFPAEEINQSTHEEYMTSRAIQLPEKIQNRLIDDYCPPDKIITPPSALDDTDDVNIKDMSAKLKQLKIQLYKNTLNSEKKSACFWCTYDFDNAPCYIPKYEMDGTIYGYGSFCRPECAVAYLMKETIDDSTKFDRYHLLNQIYSKVYECKKNIKPAPDPHYLLDKFYGNLNIQEYRRLLKTEHLLLVIDKPLTRILPELHEDTDDAFTKIYGIKASSGNSSGVYKVKRQSEQPQGPSKASIIKNTFGIST